MDKGHLPVSRCVCNTELQLAYHSPGRSLAGQTAVLPIVVLALVYLWQDPASDLVGGLIAVWAQAVCLLREARAGARCVAQWVRHLLCGLLLVYCSRVCQWAYTQLQELWEVVAVELAPEDTCVTSSVLRPLDRVSDT